MAVSVPNFGDLAYQQKAQNDDATRRTTWSQRPDQNNALGSISWNQDASGRWINNTSLNGGAQNLFNQTIGGQTNLAGQIGQGLDYSSLGAMPQVGQYNNDVIDAWQRLQQPDLDRNATATRNRLAAQGITLGSNISNTSEGNINTAYGKARDNAILQGYQQGNTEFGQALQSRQQGATELQNKYQAALSGSTNLGSTRDSLDPNKWATKVPQGAVYQPLNLYGAAGDTLSANISNANLDQAKTNATIGGVSSLLGAAGGIGGVGSALGNMYSGAKGLWNSWTTPGNGDWVTGSGNYSQYAPAGGDYGQYF